jgi:hypothetical protein
MITNCPARSAFYTWDDFRRLARAIRNLPIYKKDLPALLNFMFGDFQISTAWDQGVLNKFYDENVGRLRWSVKWNYRPGASEWL